MSLRTIDHSKTSAITQFHTRSSLVESNSFAKYVSTIVISVIHLSITNVSYILFTGFKDRSVINPDGLTPSQRRLNAIVFSQTNLTYKSGDFMAH